MRILEWCKYNLFMIWVQIGHKLFGWHYIDIYSPNKKEVTGITFSQNEEYIKKIQECEK